MFYCPGPVLQINGRSAAGLPEFSGLQRGLSDSEWRHEGNRYMCKTPMCVFCFSLKELLEFA